MASHVLCILILFPLVSGNQEYAREGVMDHLSNGMKIATNFLGSESVALKVAEFVVRAFQNANKPQTVRRRPDQYDPVSNDDVHAADDVHDYNIDEVPSPISPLKHLVRLFGLRPNQISAVAVNALVFVAQMISTFLSGPQRPNRHYRAFDDPTSWILNKNSSKLRHLIATAKNESLISKIEDIIKQQGDEETSCIQLLVCKITPFVSKMQKTVFGEDKNDYDKNVRGSAVFYRHLPSEDDINITGAACEKKHRDCDLNDL